jgi:tetratricopeptide (TPR) repeat protein
VVPVLDWGLTALMGWKLPASTVLLWAVVIAVMGAVMGAILGGPVAALAGPVAGVIAGAVAGFIPALRDDERRRRDDTARAEEEASAAQAAWDAVAEPTDQRPQGGLTALLNPDRGVVDFTGRSNEVDTLRAWCASAPRCSVRVLVGACGVGKTRLALKIAKEWEARGREWRHVGLGKEDGAVTAARHVTSGPVLLVLDYAETRTQLESLLQQVLNDPGSIRVLLVARSLGEWWDQLTERSAAAVSRLLTEAEPLYLATSISDDLSDANLVKAAVPYFADALGVRVPPDVKFQLPDSRVPVLVLHTAALVAVLRSAAKSSNALPVVVTEGLADELLNHEARYWRRTAESAGLPDEGALLKPIVAAAVLLGADNQEEAADLVARVPELADASVAVRYKWARWLYGLYPGADGKLGSLQPDLLAERHVVQQLSRNANFARSCLAGLTSRQAERALMVLTRAWAHQARAEQLIAAALNDDLATFAIPAADVAIRTKSKLGQLLAEAFCDAPVSSDALALLAHALLPYPLPYPSTVLADAYIALVNRVLVTLSGDEDPGVLAEWQARAGQVLYSANHPADALPHAQKAVAAYRVLAKTDPNRYLPDLALSLRALCVPLAQLGPQADAVPIAKEAVTVYGKLATDDPGRYLLDLARSLNNLGSTLADLRQPANALPMFREVAVILQRLPPDSPDLDLALARSRANLGITFSQLGRFADALPLAEEAVSRFRELATANPDRHRPDFAEALTNLAVPLSQLGKSDDALPIAQEAVRIFLDLTATSRNRYLPYLAESWTNLAAVLSQLDSSDDALPAAQEALTIYRELTAASRERYLPNLARSLTSLSETFSRLESVSDAKKIRKEISEMMQRLSSWPGRFS